jgi:hypothetical protein
MTDRIDDRARGNGRVPGPDPAELTEPVEAAGPVAAPAAPRRRIDTSSEWYWPVVNLIGLVAVVAVNALANTLPFNGQSTGDVLAGDPVYFQPAGWTFAIWGLIYLLLAVFVVYTFLPVGRRAPWMQGVGAAFLVANLANIAWLFLWHWEQWNLTLVAIVILLVALVLLYYALRRGRGRRAQPPTAERLMVWTPFSVYLGWATVAVLANLSVWLDRTGTDFWGMGGRWAAVALLAIAVLATAVMVVWLRDPTYGAAVAWGLLGIAAEQWDSSKLVSFSAMIAVVLVVALAVFGSLLAFELRLTGNITTAPRASARRRGFFARDGKNGDDGTP